ncbi:MAG: alpha/beta hydrolase [Actinomycetota bacterium]
MHDDHLARVAELAGIDLPEGARSTDHHVILDGRRFHYLAWGDDDRFPVLFLHGGNQSAHTWDVVCASLSDRYHCVALDQRGHGDSEWSYELDYGPAAMAGDAFNLVTHLGWRRFALVGMSLGCLASLHLAADDSMRDRLAALVAVDAGPYVSEGGGPQIIDFVSANLSHETFEDYVQAAVRHNPKRRVELLRHSLGNTVRQLSDGTWTWKADRRRPVTLDTMRTWLAPLEGLVPSIDCPVLVARGSHSHVLSAADADRFARQLRRGRTVTIADAGHAIQGDNPRGLLDAVEPFLAETVQAGAGRPGGQWAAT